MPTKPLYINGVTSDPAEMARNRANLKSSIDALNAKNTPTPVKTTPQKETTLVDRYASEKSAIKDSPVYNVKKPNEDATRSIYRQRAQATIDAIRSQFDKYLTEDTNAKNRLESKTYVSNLASGLSGSPTGGAKDYKASETGENKIRKTIQDRENLINQAYAEADLRASQDFDKKRTEYLSSQKDKEIAERTLSGNIRATAENDIATYASNYSYDDWASSAGPKRVEQYKKELGTDEAGLKLLFLKKKPQETKAFEKQIGNKYVVGYRDPVTNQTNVETIDLPSDGGDWKFQMINNEPYFVDTKAGTIKAATGYSGSAPSPVKGTPKSFTQEDVSKGREMFAQSGKGGYVDPGVYVGVYQKWLSEGGTPEAFIKLYPPEEFVDPKETDLFPTFLQPKTAKKTTTKTTTATSTPSSDFSI